MILAICLTVLFLISAAWSVVEALDNRNPRNLYAAYFLMIILALACGSAWENLGA